MTPGDIIRFAEDRTGHPLNPDEGITFGPRTSELAGVSVAWTVNEATVAQAAAAGHNCLVHHEALTHPYPGLTCETERHYLSWPTNYSRLAALARHDMTAIRLHGSLDELYIYAAFAHQLELGDPIVEAASGEYSHKVFGAPVDTFGALVEHVKRCMGMPALRTTIIDAERPVQRIGLPWGGLGLFTNVGYMQAIMDLGVDTFICGETDNYGFRFAAESGIAVIETSHEVSEAAGLRQFATDLAGSLDVACRFIEAPCVWRMS
ncbi:MAG TPA: hypothetical protein HPP77_08185 [Candidatus Hydrogenedentes bacterium]|nr:hypothetical protein [Candidatus Hydrogenedentota bacterium]HIJ74769.1 hypothetical protein [Candidatus Hydrogenedentota bacterium]